MRAPRPPALVRLLSACFVGEGSEFIRGDLDEAYRRRVAGGVRGAKRRHVADVIRSLFAWWSPGAVVRRLRSRGGAARGRGWRGPVEDARMAFRSVRRRPAFLALVVATLGLGIGATTTIFGVVDAVLLRPLPVADAERLVAVGNTFPGREWVDREADLQHLAGVSMRNFLDWEARAQTVDLAGIEPSLWLMPDRGEGPEMVRIGGVTPGVFELLSVGPALGRGFLPDDFTGDNGTVVLLSHGAWMRRHGGDPSVVGRTQATAGTGYTVIGVLPEDFEVPEALLGPGTEFWVPIDASNPRYENRGRRSLIVFGRLRPGATLASARAELDGIQAALAIEFPDGNVYPDGSRFGAGANGLQAETVGTAGRTLWIFLGASVLLLWIATLNAANLLLVRGLDRRDDLLVRAALGASRRRLMGETLAESTLLALCAGVVGSLLAYAGTAAFVHLGPGDMPRMTEVAVNVRVLVACLALSVGVGFAVGVLPALRLAEGGIASQLRSSSIALSPGGVRLRTLLVSLQLAIALVLGVGASLLFHSFLRLRSVEPGFESADAIAFSMGMKRPGAEEQPAWQGWDALLREVAAVPGVEAWGAASNLPFQSPNWAPAMHLPGGDPTKPLEGVAGYVITPGYLDAAGTRVLSGRGIEERDGPGSAPVVLVNEAFRRAFSTGRDLVGTTLNFTDDGDAAAAPTIVGVVEDVVQTRAEDGWLPAVYLPYTQVAWPVANVLLRTDRDVESVSRDLRQAAKRFTPIIPVADLSTMQARMASVRTEPRFHALLFATFAGVAMLLAGIGLYGTLAHSVGRRQRELGIRMALGAERARIFRLVLRQGMMVGALGASLGLAGALALTGLLRRYLFAVRPFDVPTFAFATLLLACVIAAAVLRPALRATRVDLTRSLRTD